MGVAAPKGGLWGASHSIIIKLLSLVDMSYRVIRFRSLHIQSLACATHANKSRAMPFCDDWDDDSGKPTIKASAIVAIAGHESIVTAEAAQG